MARPPQPPSDHGNRVSGSPPAFTRWECEPRTGVREIPLALICCPRRLSRISAIPPTTGPVSTKVRPAIPSSTRTIAGLDHRARFSTRYEFCNCRSGSAPSPAVQQSPCVCRREQYPHYYPLCVRPHACGKHGGELSTQARQRDRDRKQAPPLVAQEWEVADRPVALHSVRL